MEKVSKIQSADRVLNQVQDNIGRVLNQVSQNTIVNGLQLTGVVLQPGNNDVQHGLGHALQGWFVTDINGAAVIYRGANGTLPANQFFSLISTTAVVVDIWVY